MSIIVILKVVYRNESRFQYIKQYSLFSQSEYQ